MGDESTQTCRAQGRERRATPTGSDISIGYLTLYHTYTIASTTDMSIVIIIEEKIVRLVSYTIYYKEPKVDQYC